MSFMFNFPIPGDENVNKEPPKDLSSKLSPVSKTVDKKPPHDVEKLLSSDGTVTKLPDNFLTLNLPTEESATSIEHLQIHYLLPETSGVFPRSQDSNETPANTDLIPNVYEGGFKVWECSIDLLQYLAKMELDFSKLKVLELGCGCGLPGIYTLLKGARVDFQDFNKEVLQHATIPNVQLNLEKDLHRKCSDKTTVESGSPDKVPDEQETDNETTCDSETIIDEKCSFFAGGWEEFRRIVKPHSYDMILTSETIYCPTNYNSLLGVMETGLKENGLVLLAAKSYYFGVGGSVLDFQEVVKSKGSFSCGPVHTVKNQGVQREILELRRTSFPK